MFAIAVQWHVHTGPIAQNALPAFGILQRRRVENTKLGLRKESALRAGFAHLAKRLLTSRALICQAVTIQQFCSQVRPYTLTAMTFLMTGCAIPTNAGAKWITAPSKPLAPQQRDSNSLTSAGVDPWWAQLRDSALDVLVVESLAHSPTVEQAAARIAEARANLRFAKARKGPMVSLGASGARTLANAGGAQFSGTSGDITLGATWDVDLGGRIRNTASAAASRVEMRVAEAGRVKSDLVAALANALIESRACRELSRVYTDDLHALASSASLTHLRRAAGLAASHEELDAVALLEASRVLSYASSESCTRFLHTLEFLSGLPEERVITLVQLGQRSGTSDQDPPRAVPEGGGKSPRIVVAEQNAAAALADLRAEEARKYPSLNLAGLIGKQWLSAPGLVLASTPWSFGATLAATLFDGGSNDALGRAAQARWMLATSALDEEKRAQARDLSDAVSDLVFGGERLRAACAATGARSRSFELSRAERMAGRISQIELDQRIHAQTPDRIAAIEARTKQLLAQVAWLHLNNGSADYPQEIR